jgi:hypothetical protein
VYSCTQHNRHFRFAVHHVYSVLLALEYIAVCFVLWFDTPHKLFLARNWRRPGLSTLLGFRPKMKKMKNKEEGKKKKVEEEDVKSCTGFNGKGGKRDESTYLTCLLNLTDCLKYLESLTLYSLQTVPEVKYTK